MCKSKLSSHKKETPNKNLKLHSQAVGRVCMVDGCGMKVLAKGMCNRCYQAACRKAKGIRPLRRWSRPLSETHPHLAAELFDQSLAKKVTAGTNKKLRWRCKAGHEWEAFSSNRLAGKGCPCCSGRSVWPGFSDMATTHPTLAAELVGDPTKLVAGTMKKLRWRCKLGHEWESTGNNRVRGNGCPQCREWGYNPSKPGVFYLVRRHGQFKIGIMNVGTRRIDQHRRSGWATLDTVELSGSMALRLEVAAKRMLRRNDVPTGAKAFREKFDGYTEAWNAVDLEVRTIRQLCRRLGVKLDHYLAS